MASGMPAGFSSHDHAACRADALAAAEAHCAAARVRFTPVRRAALEILLAGHRAMGAYAVLDRLRDAGFAAQPPQAYRALDFLVEHGLAHRIERLSAFVACARPGEAHDPAFMICRACESVAEAEAAPLGETATRAGFRVESTTVEAEGLCPGCAAEGA